MEVGATRVRVGHTPHGIGRGGAVVRRPPWGRVRAECPTRQRRGTEGAGWARGPRRAAAAHSIGRAPAFCVGCFVRALRDARLLLPPPTRPPTLPPPSLPAAAPLSLVCVNGLWLYGTKPSVRLRRLPCSSKSNCSSSLPSTADSRSCSFSCATDRARYGGCARAEPRQPLRRCPVHGAAPEERSRWVRARGACACACVHQRLAAAPRSVAGR